MSVAIVDTATASGSQREQDEITVRPGATKMVPPDGGYGWVVAGACFFVTFLLSGFLKSFSALKVAIFDEFPGTTPSVAAWIPGLLGTLSLVFSPVTGVLMTIVGFRALVCVGGVLCCAGLALSYLATSAAFLIGSIGGLMGVGASFAVTTGIVCTGKYFTTRRPAAMAVALSGGCFGAMALPTAISELLLAVGLRYTFLVLAGSFALLVVCGLLFAQPERHFREVPTDDADSTVGVNSGTAGGELPRSCLKVVAERLSLRFLFDGVFLLTTASIFSMGMGNPHFLHYIPQHAKSLGVEKGSAMLLLAYSAAGDLIVRLSYGLLASRSPLPRTAEYIAAVSLSAGAVISLPFCTVYWQLIAASVAAGAGTGVWTILIPLLLSSNHGVENMNGTFTLVRLFQGVANLVYPPVAGALRAAGGDSAVLIFMGSKMCVAAAFGIGLHVAVVFRNRRQAANSLRQRFYVLTYI